VKRNYPKNEKRATFREIIASGREAFWALLMMVIILAGILTGIVTPTEASIIAVLYALFVGFFIYKELTLKSALIVIRDSMVGSAGIMVLVGFANVFAYVLTKEQIPTMIANWILSVTQNKFVILLIINIFLLFVGCFMETNAALTILFPVLLPVVTSIGVSPIQFGVMCVLNLVIGLTTPPVGVCLFITTSIGKISIAQGTKAIIPFLICNFVVLLLVTYFPPVTLWLVGLLYGI
ncbi:MAG: TRAP transporter large permease, partial [Synergistaceae bacterium]|nr:TRAP transporter large permease [Synergistaceae bacterium]